MNSSARSRIFNDHQHHEKLLKSLNEDRKLKNPKYCDLVIFTEDDAKFPVHRCILGLTSNCYERFFHNQNLEIFAENAHIDGVGKEIMAIMLDYCYTGTIAITSKNVDNIKKAGIMFGLSHIAEYCDIFNASEEHADNENVNSTTRTRSAAGIKPHKHNIEIINFEDMKHSIDNLSLNERYNKMINWIKHDVNKRGRYVIEMLEWLNMKKLLDSFLLHKRNNADNEKEPEADNSDFQNSLRLSSHKQKGDLQYRRAYRHIWCDVSTEVIYDQSTFSELDTKFKLMMLFLDDETMQGYFKSLKRNPGFLALKKKEVWKFDLSTQSIIALPNLCCDHYQGGMVQIGNKIMVISGWRTTAVETLCLEDDFPSWKTTSDMESSMKLAGCDACKNFVFCVGGTPYKNSGVRYDINDKRWTQMHVLQQDRSDGPALVCMQAPEKKSNFFYVVGGDDSKSKTAERFDSHEGKRSLLPDMKEHRSKVAAVAFHGEIYAIGGLDEHNKNLASVEKLHPHHSHWTHVSELNVPRHCHGACVVGDRIFVAGGGSNVIEIFDYTRNKWEKLERTFEELKEVECLITFQTSNT